ncbi:hypothetical protein RHMOL_Rhmol10G0033700 [Rhododendron molle]|uniref:Uncharacterized protein n=1 Tax=Rhododendron molle TaxID=49168 RepID=A0ACC0LZZ6_RHOML|nr:hypothetical protein RHMOL_Rhmol10G0033700 [Rhododendron molle]
MYWLSSLSFAYYRKQPRVGESRNGNINRLHKESEFYLVLVLVHSSMEEITNLMLQSNYWQSL